MDDVAGLMFDAEVLFGVLRVQVETLYRELLLPLRSVFRLDEIR